MLFASVQRMLTLKVMANVWLNPKFVASCECVECSNVCSAEVNPQVKESKQ